MGTEGASGYGRGGEVCYGNGSCGDVGDRGRYVFPLQSSVSKSSIGKPAMGKHVLLLFGHGADGSLSLIYTSWCYIVFLRVIGCCKYTFVGR